MLGRCVVALAILATATLATACSEILSAEATPVPGAAATLTRSSRTPIPTPVRAGSPAASEASPSPLRAAASSPVPTVQAGRTVSDQELASIQRQIANALASPDLQGMDALLLDQVSLATAQGGQVLDRDQAASWLRDHAGPGITVSQVDQSDQAVMLEVLTQGWPVRAPLDSGQVSFSLRPYDANGRPDEANGDWKIDVIDAE